MIILSNSSIHAVANPEGGAWVEQLTAGQSAVFFPKTTLLSENGEEKARGGMHVCLPNFGPGGESGLPQHGFGRTEAWIVGNTTNNSVELSLLGGSTHYAQLASTLRYLLEENSFVAVLTVTNNGAKPLRIAPAFHPYFAIDDGETAVKINGTTYELDELADTEFLASDMVELVTARQTVKLSQTGLSTWAVWTDRLGSYVCVEPTSGGYRFLESEQPEESLQPSQTRNYSFRIEWN